MPPLKFVIKCGNFAVLVDLHVLPLGGREDASWFTADHIEEATALVRDAVDQRVKQYAETLHNRKQAKQKKELAPAAALVVKGKNFDLVANFLKRHFNLRCIVKTLYRDLRVFPERYVVCVSCSEDASAHRGNPSPAATELCEQSRSEYFSRVGETQEPSNSPGKTKKTALQKLAKQAKVQQEQHCSSPGKQLMGQRACPRNQAEEVQAGESELNLRVRDHQEPFPRALNEAAQMLETQNPGLTQQQTEKISSNGTSLVSCQSEIFQETSKTRRCKPSDAGVDPHPQRTKRTCLGKPPASTQTKSSQSSTQTSMCDPLPLQTLPPAEVRPKAFLASECNKKTLEVEQLTPGKQGVCPRNQAVEVQAGESELRPKETLFSSEMQKTDHQEPFPGVLNEAAQMVETQNQGLTQQPTEKSPPDSISPSGTSMVSCQSQISQETSKRCKPSDAGEDPHPQRTKRTCLGRPPASTQNKSSQGSMQTSKRDPLPLQTLPPAEAESKAFPASECNKTTLEVGSLWACFPGVLTPGKRAQRLPLTSNNTAQTNQNRLATSLRGLSVKPASSGSSISSRSTLAEEGCEYVPRTSRLRRQKRS